MDTIDLVFSFDTTGSMMPCITQVRRYLDGTIKYLFEQIPELRIGIIAHGDYCDRDRVITLLDLTNDVKAIRHFVQFVHETNGGDLPEAYELVLNRVRTMNWTGGKNKAFIMIGDDVPHEVGYKYGAIKNDLNWRNEQKLLRDMGIALIGIQALGKSWSTKFYESFDTKLDLNQFADINDIIMALCMARAEKLPEFEKLLDKRGNVSYNVYKAIDTLSGKKVRKAKTNEYTSYAVHPARFQILDVDRNCPIKIFVQDNGLRFKIGRGFYQFTKTETVQDYKEVVLRDKMTGDMFSGDKAREIAGLPVGVTTRLRPCILSQYDVFVQSTSNNRKLIGGTKFLYEVDASI